MGIIGTCVKLVAQSGTELCFWIYDNYVAVNETFVVFLIVLCLLLQVIHKWKQFEVP